MINMSTDLNPLNEEKVDHPKHYNREGAMECINEMAIIFGIEDTLAFCKLNAWKYRYRAGDKNGEEDLKKSDWYIHKYMELLQMTQPIILKEDKKDNNIINWKRSRHQEETPPPEFS